jgi:hypothetical protein
MKKIGIMLAVIAVLGVVGGALAFNMLSILLWTWEY